MYLKAIVLVVVFISGVLGTEVFDYTNECYLNPCTHGFCLDGDQAYTCICEPGYTGRRCCTDIDECVANLCVNGTCSDAVNGYTCICDPGFEGQYCDKNIDDCVNKTCINATCVDELNDFTCLCPANYTGSCDWRTYDLTEGYLSVEASSSGWGGAPQYALNGIKDGLHNVNPCYHNGNDRNPWWKVTLKEPYNIRRIVVTNRLEGWSRRFRDITVYVDDEVCAVYPGPANWEQLTVVIPCERDDLVGQTVKIMHEGSILTLCEVEIYMY